MNGVVESMSLHPVRGPVALLSLLFVLALAVAGCFGDDEGKPVEDRLVSKEQAAGIGLHHCVVNEDMQEETGIMSNPGQVPAEFFAGADQAEAIEEFWLQLLGPEEDVVCDEVPQEDLVIVSAMVFGSERDLDESLADDNMCEQVSGTLLVGGAHAVATEGNSTRMDDVAAALAAQNRDLSEPCT